MYKIGEKVVITKPDVWIIKKHKEGEDYDECFVIGEILTIEVINDIPWNNDDTVTYEIRNEKGFSWVDGTEIESLRKYKLKRVLCIK